MSNTTYLPDIFPLLPFDFSDTSDHEPFKENVNSWGGWHEHHNDIDWKEVNKNKTGLRGELNGMYGKTHTPEARKKISEAFKNVPLTEEHKKNISEGLKGHTWNRGRIHSEISKRNMGEARKGKKHSEETKKKMSIAQRKRFKTL